MHSLGARVIVSNVPSNAPFRVVLAAATLSVLSAAACTTNHDAFAKKPGGAGGGGSGGGGFGGGGFGNAPSGAQGGMLENPDNEPPGDDVLTIVNGVVDAESVQLCFARSRDGGVPEPFGLPLPERELGYAQSIELENIEGAALTKDYLEPWVLAGNLSLIEGLVCEQAIALAQEEEARATPDPEALAGASAGGAAGEGGADAQGGAGAEGGAGGARAPKYERPALRARALPQFSPGTFAIGRSVLMVLSGCLGGPAFRDDLEALACGARYADSLSTAGAVVVKLSRDVSFPGVALQAVQASLGTELVDIRVAGGEGDVSIAFANELTYGAIAPRPPEQRFGPAELGTMSGRHGVQALRDGVVHLQESWSTLFDRSGIEELESGRGYSLVLVGPSSDTRKLGFWQRPAFALVVNDPTR